jgi:soluble lytic murein transglycosylase-like protein
MIAALFFYLTSQAAYSKPETYSSVLKQIKKNHKSMPGYKAAILAKEIFVVCKKYRISPRLYAAILMQESAYNPKAVNCDKNDCNDFGISQINKHTIKRYKFDKNKIMRSLPYAVEAGAIVLSTKEHREVYESRVTRFY